MPGGVEDEVGWVMRELEEAAEIGVIEYLFPSGNLFRKERVFRIDRSLYYYNGFTFLFRNAFDFNLSFPREHIVKLSNSFY